jgi:hypothetical protein
VPGEADSETQREELLGSLLALAAAAAAVMSGVRATVGMACCAVLCSVQRQAERQRLAVRQLLELAPTFMKQTLQTDNTVRLPLVLVSPCAPHLLLQVHAIEGDLFVEPDPAHDRTFVGGVLPLIQQHLALPDDLFIIHFGLWHGETRKEAYRK